MTLPKRPKCGCCDDTGDVIGADGEKRPCSRCRWDEFTAWKAKRLREFQASEASKSADG